MKLNMTTLAVIAVLAVAPGLAGCSSNSSADAPSKAAVALGLKTTPIPPTELAQAEAHYKQLKSKWASPAQTSATGLQVAPAAVASAPTGNSGG